MIEAQAAHQYALALSTAHDSPYSASALCLELKDPALKDDCVWAIAPKLLPADPTGAAALCDALSEAGRSECYFVLGERVLDVSWCVSAGSLEERCRIHVYMRRFGNTLGGERRPAMIYGLMLQELRAAGLSEEEIGYQIATWLDLLRREREPPKGWCLALPDGTPTQACEAAMEETWPELEHPPRPNPHPRSPRSAPMR